jgi:hypothetical protein
MAQFRTSRHCANADVSVAFAVFAVSAVVANPAVTGASAGSASVS